MPIYRFKRRDMSTSFPERRTDRPRPAGRPEPDYQVRGQDASDLEYFWAQSLDRHDIDFIFKWIVRTPWSWPTSPHKIDFMIRGREPYELDGEIAHKSQEQKAEDIARDTLLNTWLAPRGIYPIKRVSAFDLEVVTATPEEKAERIERYVMENVV